MTAKRTLTLSVAKHLRKALPPAFPVSVRARRELDDRNEAECSLVGTEDKRRFVIDIASRLSDREAVDALRHEWAHALAWSHLDDKRETDDDNEWHTDVWGVCYARVYRATV
jgi:hypothetical protein